MRHSRWRNFSEWKETGGGSHAAGHALHSPTIYLKARRFPFAHYDPTQRCTYDDVSARLSFCTYHYLDTRAIWAWKDAGEQSLVANDQEKLRLRPIYENETNRLHPLQNDILPLFSYYSWFFNPIWLRWAIVPLL